MRFRFYFSIRSLMLLVLLVALATGAMIAMTRHLQVDRALQKKHLATQKKLDGWRVYAWHRFQQQICKESLASRASYDVARRAAVYTEAEARIPGAYLDQPNAVTDQGGWQSEANNHQYWADRFHDQFIHVQEIIGL